MATVTHQWVLVYQIQKRPSDLSTSQLLKFASLIDEGGVIGNVFELSGPELHDLLVDYIRSKKLEALEDGGMSQFLLLDDMLSDLLALDAGEVGASQTELLTKEDSTNCGEGHSGGKIQRGSQTTPHGDCNPKKYLNLRYWLGNR